MLTLAELPGRLREIAMFPFPVMVLPETETAAAERLKASIPPDWLFRIWLPVRVSDPATAKEQLTPSLFPWIKLSEAGRVPPEKAIPASPFRSWFPLMVTLSALTTIPDPKANEPFLTWKFWMIRSLIVEFGALTVSPLTVEKSP